MARVRYELRDGIGWIDLDDGRVNALSPAMQDDIHLALDRAVDDDVVTVLRGRPGVFSAGFDLEVMARGDDSSALMVLGGFELARRVLGHERPVVVACPGHAVAMGLFLLLAGDHRIGVTAPSRIVANEVAIGLTLPHAADVLLRSRLTPSAHQAAALLAHPFGPAEAVAAGVLDEVVEPGDLDDRVAAVAAQLTALDPAAQRATKRRLRAGLLDDLDRAIERDAAHLRAVAAGGAVGM